MRELDQHLIDGAEWEPLARILVPALKNKILREGKEGGGGERDQSRNYHTSIKLCTQTN